MDRRKAIKSVSLGLWVSPIVQMVVMPLHAQTSNCVSEPPFGILVTVLDANTGVDIACQASGTITDGTYTEALSHYHPFYGVIPAVCDSPTLGGALKRPGRYQLTISALGYIDFSAADIIVRDEACYTNTVSIEVQLKAV